MRGRSVVLLSGGMDSATCLAEAVRAGPTVALTVGYGQRHRRELESARSLARHYRLRRHIEVELPLGEIAPSALTDPKVPVPRAGSFPGRIPPTYVPARNTILLSLALALAETTRAESIWLGINAVDYSGYPDCRPEFLRAFQRMTRWATRSGVGSRGPVRIRAPLLRLSKAEIVRRGDRFGVPFELTWSCYRGGRSPCGDCDACRLRALGFRQAGRVDPLRPGGARRRGDRLGAEHAPSGRQRDRG
ncbi:MAG: 7-cyano-7-deazaguanine synthase QueC [Thermoplasmata archaeon]